ncbi:MAG: DEAD/DEAH box helicase family protein [Coriobacteriales bacterium]|jgi:superfamily II DNA or RNA helicase|nr:DEAD/DEAH box helicase family protein [Coriobacteriales bacterium]
MKDFSTVRFKGTFRNYQQKVLDEVKTHIKDTKVHIVAAPGSGKTVLGLELMCRLGKPALVLSPTIVIAQQWGDRFEEMFLPEGAQTQDYVSQNLRNPALITSITYQALHAAYSRLVLRQEMFESDEEGAAGGDGTGETEEDADLIPINEPVMGSTEAVGFTADGPAQAAAAQAPSGSPSETQTYDFRDFALIDFIRTSGIKTICLDEAHHLRREWQKALEGFIQQIEHEVTIISLTATPPYDSTPAEWNRYIALCGEIDSEIFVPELVAQKTLCPHQDYLYFNFPTNEELGVMREYQDRVLQFLGELRGSTILGDALVGAGLYRNNYREEWLYENAQEVLALFALCQHTSVIVPEGPLRRLTMGSPLPPVNPLLIENALNFVLDNDEAFGEATVSRLASLCRAHRLLSRGRAIIATNSRLNRALISSLGKLESISAIVGKEYAQLGSGLRMLVLTDFIRKDYLSVVGSQSRIDAIGTVPVFETVRRALPAEGRIGLLAGTLVIWPTSQLDRLQRLAADAGAQLRAQPLGETAYSTVEVSGGNRLKVGIVTEAFQQGDVQVLVGTKALLGEGWDSPCINSLIMASFIGSYVLSNQMRGRAIRTMKGVPNKTANVWHLVAVEPPGAEAGVTATATASAVSTPGAGTSAAASKDAALFTKALEDNQDFRTLKRRFECFFGPAYTQREIASGIERIDIIKPPFDANGIAAINAEMLRRATDRARMARDWETCLVRSGSPDVFSVSTVPKAAVPKPFVFKSLRRFLISAGALVFLLNLWQEVLIRGIVSRTISPPFVLALAVASVLLIVAFFAARQVLRFLNPTKTVEAFARSVRDLLCELGKITTPGTVVKVNADELGLRIRCTLDKATIREQNLFTQAMSELLGAIDNPRYLLIKRKSVRARERWDYRESYACPAVVSSAKTAELFMKYLKKRGLAYRTVYTRNAEGFRILNACRNKSRVTRNAEPTRRYQRLGKQ